MRQMLSEIPNVKREMIKRRAKVAIIAKTEGAMDIPEHSYMQHDGSGIDWNARSRGFGGTPAIPTMSCGEENILCHSTADRYPNEDIFIHEFAHSIHELGLNFAYSNFAADLQKAYQSAKSKGLWKNTYAMTDHKEYFAEIVQCWFDTNDENNKEHNAINTRKELKNYDVLGYQLVEKYFTQSQNRCSCH